jgi:hypothetical protein
LLILGFMEVFCPFLEGHIFLGTIKDEETALTVYGVSSIITLVMEIGGLVFLIIAEDDFHRAILEYNRTQVDKGCAAAGNNAVLVYNLKF